MSLKNCINEKLIKVRFNNFLGSFFVKKIFLTSLDPRILAPNEVLRGWFFNFGLNAKLAPYVHKSHEFTLAPHPFNLKQTYFKNPTLNATQKREIIF